jgi:hypothetical protein
MSFEPKIGEAQRVYFFFHIGWVVTDRYMRKKDEFRLPQQ